MSEDTDVRMYKLFGIDEFGIGEIHSGGRMVGSFQLVPDDEIGLDEPS